MTLPWVPTTTPTVPLFGPLPTNDVPCTKRKADEMEEEQPAAQSCTIDLDGDLWMQLSGGRILVCRKVLRLSSKVFNAMLGSPKFGESVNPSFANDGIQEAFFPDDDYESMRIVAHIIHLQSDLVPQSLPFHHISKLAILCDKYDLRQSLGPWPDIWMKEFQTPPDNTWFECLLIAAVFRRDGLFYAVTDHLIRNTFIDAFGTLSMSREATFSEALPTKIIGTVPLGTQSSLLTIGREHQSR